MKNKCNLGNVKVEESLCNKHPSSNNEVVAYYISSEISAHNGLQTTIEHFDTNGLRDFLYSREKENNGVLQRFIDSKGTGNTVFRVIWSPNIFHAERRVNVLDISDRKHSMHQRVVTFEGQEFHSETTTVTDTSLGSQMQASRDRRAPHDNSRWRKERSCSPSRPQAVNPHYRPIALWSPRPARPRHTGRPHCAARPRRGTQASRGAAGIDERSW